MFESYPTYSPFRTLKLDGPPMRGEDVFSLQTALDHVGFDTGGQDGVLGNQTALAITHAQQKLGLAVDGLAGGGTQKALALRVAAGVQARYHLPARLLEGQLEHESGFRLGNYSAARPDGSYDAGVAQRNTAHTPAREGFTVPDSIDALGERVREHYDLFAGLPTGRRWRLAQGSWNAPGYACFLAREEGATRVTRAMTLEPGVSARKTFEAYIAAVSKYLTVS